MRPRFIDIHAHTNFTAFDADRQDVVRRALDQSVWIINVGTQKDTSRKAVEMTKEFPEGVYAVIGLHPIHVNPSFHDTEEIGEGGSGFSSRGETFDPEYYRMLAKEGGKKVVGIGECGLDYYRMPSDEERARQKAAFRAQIELALELDLPLMLHIRSGAGGNAYREALDILGKYKKEYGDKLRGDAHFFAGSLDDAREFLDLGFHLSYTGVVTFAKQYKELVQATPIDRIMSETDCPYVAPIPERGKRNEPSFVIHTADKILGIKEMALDEGRAKLVDNAFRLFRL
ncbi:MAG TPA: TatD family hydrolase [Candidatus Paceibacterota bacterium]|nr:TatD family hydrolase [Candidatus Paceibacterota bacterium]